MAKTLKNGILFAAVVLLMCCCCCGLSVFAADEPLAIIAPEEVLDGNVRSSAPAAEGLTITAEEEIGSLYLQWNLLPGQWTLEANGEKISCGEKEWLHQYVVLDTPAKEVTLYADVKLDEVSAFAPDAELPDWVQVWQDPLERADLLLLPTHADDEHIFFGGMMPYYAGERGLKVQVVYLTNHWGEKHRVHELLDGLWTVGIRNYPVIGPFDDIYAHNLKEAESIFTREAPVEFLVENLRRFKPSVVIGHDLEGEYGHGVHILNAYALTDAVELAGLDAFYPESLEKYGSWNTPKLYLHLYPRDEIQMDWYQPLEAFGGKTALEVAVEGFDKHISQRGGFEVYGTYHPYDSQLYGLYRSTVGRDKIGGDVFENITSYY